MTCGNELSIAFEQLVAHHYRSRSCALHFSGTGNDFAMKIHGLASNELLVELVAAEPIAKRAGLYPR